MAFTRVDLDRFDKALASGKREMRLNGRVIVYQTLSEMLKARDVIKAEVEEEEARTAGTYQRRRPAYRVRSKMGW